MFSFWFVVLHIFAGFSDGTHPRVVGGRFFVFLFLQSVSDSYSCHRGAHVGPESFSIYILITLVCFQVLHRGCCTRGS